MVAAFIDSSENMTLGVSPWQKATAPASGAAGSKAGAAVAQNALDDVVVRPRPVPMFAQLPAVDDIPHQVQGVGIVVVQEVEKEFRLAPGGAQVNIGNPEGAPVRGADLGHGRFPRGCAHAWE